MAEQERADQSRGKILPQSVRGSLAGEMDQRLAMVMLSSFVVHFGFVIYLRTVDWPRQPEIEEIPDRFVQALVPKRPAAPKEEDRARADPGADQVAPRPERRSPERGKLAPKQDDPAAAAQAAAVTRARLEELVSRSGVLGVLGSRGAGAEALVDVLRDGGPGSDADDVFRQVGGVSLSGPGAMNVKGGGGGLSRGIDGLRAAGPSEVVGTGDKGERRVQVQVSAAAPPDLDSAELDPQAVAAKMRQYKGALQACYESALKRNPSLSGKLTLRFTITRLGKVSQAQIEADTMHDDDVNKCVVERAMSWRFPLPSGGGDEVQFAYPFIFQAAK